MREAGGGRLEGREGGGRGKEGNWEGISYRNTSVFFFAVFCHKLNPEGCTGSRRSP
jgi:hypothetical protein